ncbi:type VI secretion system baseplate subunit TssG [Vibrio sp.]|nr:type VI secretion system baseplate subunit TssG [Vibrio sp.]
MKGNKQTAFEPSAEALYEDISLQPKMEVENHFHWQEERTWPLPKVFEDKSHEFSFFQVISLLEKRYQALDHNNFTGVGKADHFENERIRFSVSAELGYPRHDIDFIQHGHHSSTLTGEDKVYTRVQVNFLGLHGSSSPLPSNYTEKLAGRDEDENPVKQFLDFFHHNTVTMAYQIWKKYRYHVQFHQHADDPFSQRLFYLFGAPASVQKRLEKTRVGKPQLLRYISQFTNRTRSPKMLEGVISHYFSIPDVKIEEWVYRQVDIHESQQNRLGQTNCTLNEDAHLGESMPSLGGKFNIWFNNLDMEQYQYFLPDQEGYKQLKTLMQLMLKDPLAWDIKLQLKPEHVPAPQLGQTGSLLGATTWIGDINQNDSLKPIMTVVGCE